MKRSIFPCTIVALLLLNACSPKHNPYSSIPPISESNVYAIRKDTTNRQQVESMFGRPAKRTVTETGDWYTYAHFGDTLNIQFNQTGVVNSFNYIPESFRLVSDNRDVTSRRFYERVLNRITPGYTTIDDVNRMFGKYNTEEQGLERKRYTYISGTQRLLVYTTLTDQKVISYRLE